MPDAKKPNLSEARQNAAEAARQATELAALNIQKYLDANAGGRVQGNNMVMHEEQFSKVLQASVEFARDSLTRFAETKK